VIIAMLLYETTQFNNDKLNEEHVPCADNGQRSRQRSKLRLKISRVK